MNMPLKKVFLAKTLERRKRMEPTFVKKISIPITSSVSVFPDTQAYFTYRKIILQSL